MDAHETTSTAVNPHPDAAVPSGDRQVEPGYCPECDYCLAGLPGDRCPECGYALHPAELTASAIPWVHRRRIGHLRAYWRTVWLVLFRGGRFHGEFQRPVSYRHAQRFRWVTVVLAYLFVLVTVPVGLRVVLPAVVPFGVPVDKLGWGLRISISAVICLSLLLALVAMSGLPSYFFHPRRLPIGLQNRAIAMSYYALAPLAWMPLSLVFFGLAALLLPFEEAIGSSLGLAGLLLPAVLVLVWWFELVRLARLTRLDGLRGQLLVAVGVPLLWLIVGGLILLGLPLAVFLLAVILFSLL